MSSKIKPTKTAGSSPVFSYGGYTEMSNTPTQQDYINKGAKFKHSVFKTPFGDKSDYPSMEFAMSPGVFQPIEFPFPPLPKTRPRVPLTSGDRIIKPWDCTCSGACTGDVASMNELWVEVDKAIADGRIHGAGLRPGTYSDWNFHMSMKSFMRDYMNTHLTFSFSTVLAMDYQCQGKGIELADKTLICGGKEEFGHLKSTALGDYQEAKLWYVVPFPLNSKCKTEQNCACWFISTYVDCGAGFIDCDTPRDIYMTTCQGMTRLIIRPSPGYCSDLSIVNEDGSAALDTILKGGNLDFNTTGECCENIQWTVSPETGGTTISSIGVLTAGATSCGSLLVTASCPACGTSATQYVRVTDDGLWVLVNTITYGTYDGATAPLCTCISGKTKEEYLGACCFTTGTCDSRGYTGWLQYNYICDGVGSYCSLASGESGCIRFKHTYEWQC